MLGRVISRFARWYDSRLVTGDALLAVLLLVAFVLPSELAEADDVAVGLAFSVALYTLVAYGPGARLGAIARACAVIGALLAAARWTTSDNAVSGSRSSPRP